MVNPTNSISNNKPTWVTGKVADLTEKEDVSADTPETEESVTTLPQLPEQASPTAIAVLSQILSGTPPSPPRPTLPSEASETAFNAVNKFDDDTEPLTAFPQLPTQASSTAVDVLSQLAAGTKPPIPPVSSRPDLPTEVNSSVNHPENQPALPPAIPDLPTQANVSARSKSRGLRHFGSYI